jgi:glycerol kinase
MRWKARSSSPVRPCNGCATGSESSARPAETGRFAAASDPTQDVYLVPAFTGLGAPHWDPDARGAHLRHDTRHGAAELRPRGAGGVCYQTRDLLDAMRQATGRTPTAPETVLRVDGGMVAIRLDACSASPTSSMHPSIARPVLETTAVGAAYLAGQRAGVWPDRRGFAKSWARDTRFEPEMDEKTRAVKIKGWKDAVRRTLSDR